MKTSAISNPVNLTSGTASTTKPSGVSSEVPFSQMLSREMAARPKTSEPAKTDASQGSKEPKTARSESKSENTQSTEKSDANTPAQSVTGTVTTDKSGTSKSDKTEAKKAKGDNTDQDEDATVSAASADLLALVASLTQPAIQASTDTDSSEDGEQTTLNASDDGAKSNGQPQDLQDLSVIVQAAAPVQNVLLTAQAAAPVQSALLAAQATEPSENLPIDIAIAAHAPDQLRSEAGTIPAADKAGKALTGPASAATRRGIGIAPEGRAAAAAPDKQIASEPGEFDAKLAQAKDDKPAGAAVGSKASTTPTEVAVTQPADRQTMKTAQDVQQPAAVPFNINSLSATQAQQAPQMVAQAVEMLSPRVGSQGWDQALGQKVVWMVGSELQSASLTLNPPDLGPLQVVLHVSENQATANFTAAQPEVRHALEAAMPKLREMLSDAGIQLGQANVSAGMPNNQQSAFGQPQQSSRNTAATNESSDAPAMRVGRSQTITGGQGLVDTFA